jgi:hypothetical protein
MDIVAFEPERTLLNSFRAIPNEMESFCWPGLADCFVGRLGRMRRATSRAALRAFVSAATNRTVSISLGIALSLFSGFSCIKEQKN